MPHVVDVPELLARLGIKAERRGREHWACCPLPEHHEDTPSWQIRDDEGNEARHARWRCLGCHEGGGAVGLVMRLLQFPDPRDAAAWIRSGASNERIALAVELVPAGGKRFGFHLPPGCLFDRPLAEWVGPARAYAEDRGLDDAQIDRWGVGFAVDGKLAGRIVIPWRTREGKLIRWTARSYLGNGKKYLEPPSEDGADRSAVYGEEHWPPPGQRCRVVLTEGSFDGYAVERATSLPFAALAGSQLLPGHVARLSTWEEVVIAADPDRAGKGLLRAVQDALVRHVRLRVGTLPAGFDANKLERARGGGALREALGELGEHVHAPPGAHPEG